MTPSSRHLSVLLLVTLCLAPALQASSSESLDRGAILTRCADGVDRFWLAIADREPYESLGCRKVFASAMAICEARRGEERLSRLYDLAARFQDRDPQSTGYGNLRWYWRDSRVTDPNAVEFCMQDALLTWIHHRQWMPERARKQLRELMVFGMEGCMRHRVRTSYTNIALLNAANLIGLGEAFDRPDVADEGYRRLRLVCLWTWRYGTHEYCSPTYYGVDLQGIMFLLGHAKREQGRQQAEALANLFWTDIALNWFAPAQRLAGAQSRSYDYLHGLGSLDAQLQVAGWIDDPIVPTPAMIHPLRASFAPSTLADNDLAFTSPRLVRQSWGPSVFESRTHMLYEDITLSTSAANYGSQDMPLTVDLPGDRRDVRCYFIPDGREDPYGKVKYATGSANHRKALHLKPFWMAAQRTCDAVGLVIYRDRDLQEDVVTNLQSHFVLRRQNDGVWLAGKPIELAGATKDSPASTQIAIGTPLIVRYGTAAIGIRVLWAQAQDATPAAMALVDDANRFGAMRLTIDHQRDEVTASAGAAFWVRVGHGLKTESQFQAWRSAFEEIEPATVEATDNRIRLGVAGLNGPVVVSADAPFDSQSHVELVPLPTGRVLELASEEDQGTARDVGREILSHLEPVRKYREQLARVRPIAIPASGEITWEAEEGVVFPGMSCDEDDQASGGICVGSRNDALSDARTGSLTFQLDVAVPGTYYLWARVLAPDPKTDSFYVLLEDSPNQPPRSASWHAQHGPGWRWQPIAFDRAKEPAKFNLTAGRTPLQFRIREAGTKIDQLFLSRNPDSIPGEP